MKKRKQWRVLLTAPLIIIVVVVYGVLKSLWKVTMGRGAD